MKEQRPLSIIYKILFIFTISLSICIFFSSYFIFNTIKKNLWLNFKSRSERVIEDLKYAVYPIIDLLKIKKLFSELTYDPNIYYIAIFTEEGHILYNYTNPYKKFVLVNPPTQKEIKTKKVKLKLFIYTKIKDKITIKPFNFSPLLLFSNQTAQNVVSEVTIPIFVKEKSLGIIKLGYVGEYLLSSLKEAYTIILIVSISIFLVSIIFSYIFLRKQIKPITILSSIVEKISNGDINVSVPLFYTSYEVYMLSSRMMHMLWGLREREYIKTIFGKFIDKKLAEKILSDKDITKGKKKNVTILYIDMRDFTKFTEENSPEEVVSTLNEFFTIAVNSIKNYGGIIDKFIGDAVLALFGAIEETGDEPEKAVSAAKEFINNLEEFNKKRAQQSKPEIKVGVTIHIGEVIVGNIGSEEKQEFTVVGDAVNTASRMQLYNRQFNLPLLISKEIAERLDKNKFKTKFISSVSIRGKKSAVDLYTVED